MCACAHVSAYALCACLRATFYLLLSWFGGIWEHSWTFTASSNIELASFLRWYVFVEFHDPVHAKRFYSTHEILAESMTKVWVIHLCLPLYIMCLFCEFTWESSTFEKIFAFWVAPSPPPLTKNKIVIIIRFSKSTVFLWGTHLHWISLCMVLKYNKSWYTIVQLLCIIFSAWNMHPFWRGKLISWNKVQSKLFHRNLDKELNKLLLNDKLFDTEFLHAVQ